MSRGTRCRVLLAAACATFGACSDPAPQVHVSGGDGDRGREFIQRYGCGSCHIVPGISSARGQVGPPLDGIARRAYLGGMLPNTAENMISWIRHPQHHAPRTAMPDLGVSEPEARDMTAYLYTLK